MCENLTPILEKLKTVDAIVFGSPIYYMNITARMGAFLERFLFSNSIYSFEIPTVYPKKLNLVSFILWEQQRNNLMK